MNKPEIRTHKIAVDHDGVLELAITAITLRSASPGPKIAIVNGLHGEERTGALLMSSLVKRQLSFSGTLTFIPFANPISALENTRLTPDDNIDLNRVFPGNERGTISYRIAAALHTFLKEYDLVIDIHTFPNMDMPCIGVFFDCGTQTQRQQIIDLLTSFSPEYIWKLDTQHGETAKAGSMVEALIASGTLAFAVEVPDIELISDDIAEACTDRLINVIHQFGKHSKKMQGPTKAVERVPALANDRGIFVGRIPLHAQVKSGDTLGEVILLDTFERVPITSPMDGVVLFTLRKTVVSVGQRVAIVGAETEIKS